MPQKRNFLGGMQNYNKETGEYESALVGKNGKVVKDADGDGKAHESAKARDSKFGNLSKDKLVDKVKNLEWSDIIYGYNDEGKVININDYNEETDKFNAYDENGKTFEMSYEDVAKLKKVSTKSKEQDFNDPKEADRYKEQERDFNEPKNRDRKDKYGNSLVSDEAFKVGQEAVKKYLNENTEDLETLKKSNVFIGGLTDEISDALTEAGFNENYDLTYQDYNEIIGSVVGEEVDTEAYEENATKGWTGKKYSGYAPGKDLESDEDAIWDKYNKGEITEQERNEKLSNRTEKIVNKSPSLRDRRKEWRNNLSKSGDEYNQGTQELYRKLKSGEISRKEYNQGMKALQEKYIKSNTKPQRDRLAVDDELESYDKQFKSIREELDPLEDEDNIAFNRHLMFNEPYDESKKNPRIAELNKQLKDVKDKRTDARRRLARELGSQFGRKDYRKEIDSGNLPSGNDRVYAMYQKSLEEPYLDFKRMIANDVYDNVEKYPRKLEFEDELFEISKSGGAYDHYKKENGKWVHVSTGTIAGLGDYLGEKLEEENLK